MTRLELSRVSSSGLYDDDLTLRSSYIVSGTCRTPHKGSFRMSRSPTCVGFNALMDVSLFERMSKSVRFGGGKLRSPKDGVIRATSLNTVTGLAKSLYRSSPCCSQCLGVWKNKSRALVSYRSMGRKEWSLLRFCDDVCVAKWRESNTHILNRLQLYDLGVFSYYEVNPWKAKVEAVRC